MIFNQQSKGICVGFAFLGALKIMNPSIDHDKILSELMDDSARMITAQQALKFFRERGYIKDIKYVAWTPLLLKKTPIISGISGMDGVETGKPPYFLKFDNTGSHWICFTGYDKGVWKIKNSWGEDWGDKGYFYYKGEMKKFKRPFVLVI